MNLNPIIQFAVNQGVPLETITYLLMFSLVVFIMAAARHILGVKAFGIYTPSIIAIAFISTGLKYGVFLFAVILITGTLTRLIFKKIRLLYFPRIAIMLSSIAIAVLLVLVFGGYFNRTGLAAVSIFPILILITIMEKFILVQIEKGFKTALFLSLETLLLSVFASIVVKIPFLQALLLAHPWIILIILLMDLLLGKWAGLRLTEYFRFKEIIKHVDLPQKK